VKINNLDTYCEWVEEVRTAKRNDYCVGRKFVLEKDPSLAIISLLAVVCGPFIFSSTSLSVLPKFIFRRGPCKANVNVRQSRLVSEVGYFKSSEQFLIQGTPNTYRFRPVRYKKTISRPLALQAVILTSVSVLHFGSFS
jgi:hypothetical protein